MMTSMLKEPQILLVHPIQLYMEGRHRIDPAPSLASLTIGSALLNSGIEVVVLDAFAMYSRGESDWVCSVNQIISRYPSIKIVGITVYANFRFIVDNIINSICDLSPNTNLVLGGPHVSSLSTLYANYYSTKVSAIVVGDGTRHIALFKKLLSDNFKITGANIYSDNDPKQDCKNTIKRTDLPVIDYTQWFASQNCKPTRATFITYIGCHYKTCKFCFNSSYIGSPAIRRMEDCKNELLSILRVGVKRLEIHDTDALWDTQRISIILKDTPLSNIDSCYCHTDFSKLTDNKINSIYDKLPNLTLFSGLESGSARLRKIIKGRGNDDTLRYFAAGMQSAKNKGIRTGVFIVFGHPEETFDDIIITFKFLIENKPDEVYGSIIKYIPGTQLYQDAVLTGSFDEKMWLDSNQSIEFFVPNETDLPRSLAALEYLSVLFPSAREHNKCGRQVYDEYYTKYSYQISIWLDKFRIQLND